MIFALRKALVGILALVIAGGSLVHGLAASVNADCVTAQASADPGGCCSDLPAVPGCDKACPTGGSACAFPAHPGTAARFDIVLPSTPQLAAPASYTQAPETAPPKHFSA